MCMSILSPVIAQNNDSLICLPKNYTIKIIKELETKDLLEKQNIILQENNILYEEKIRYKDSIIYNQRLLELNYLKDYKDLQEIIDNKDKLLFDLNKQIKKQKFKSNLIIGGYSIVVTGLVIGFMVYSL